MPPTQPPSPTAFAAVTVNVYVVPFVRPVTTVEVAGGVPVTVVGVCATAPTNGVTAYEVIGLPPSTGATQLTVAEVSPAEADTPVGASGTVADPPEASNTTSTQ